MKFRISTSKTFFSFVFGFVALNCLALLGSDAQVLPDEEVQVLGTISSKLGVTFWNVSKTSCDGSLNRTYVGTSIMSGFTCDCSFSNGTTCHVTNILLKGLNLTGQLPSEFANLTYLREIDLTRNYINGTIPRSWGSLPLVSLSLLGNRITGTIPTEFGDISTLESMVLEDNQLGGPLPQSIGRLSKLRRVLLSANNFTGTIPETYGNLKNITDFRIDGSGLTGKIPEFIGNWTKIIRLDFQGTLMEGPLPSSLSLLKNLTELRISDLNGSTSSFPNIQNLTLLQILTLRNCSLGGTIPSYIGDMTELKTLDLTFNRLTGEVPSTLEGLTKIRQIFLSHNSLTGTIPDWIINSKQNMDLSYNNFTESSGFNCQSSNVNLIASHSPTPSNSVAWCLNKELTCTGDAKYHSLYINCGGNRVNTEGNDYEEDTTPGGPSNFFSISDKWAYSSTGVYMNNDNAKFIAANTNVTGPIFYSTARLSPQSLKYYGLCMRRGSYRVKLHFAEIMYSDDQTFSSLGRRIFDVSIQGKIIRKDFNIMEEAKGVGRGITLDINDVLVNGSTLEIHLYWVGRGTTAIPDRGVYGPLISAITVTPNFDVSTGLSVGAIVGIVAASLAVLALILLILWWRGCFGRKDQENNELRGLDLQTGYFTLKQIKAATGNFDAVNKIGEGGFGPVYKGVLSDGGIIAVKQLSSKSKQGNREFVNEIGMISALQHPNLVKLYGCCIEGNQLLLIYEYLENNSLARALFGSDEQKLNLDWATRQTICLQIARGLAYLHEESRLKIVHRDIKATNVLLDKDLNAKISDFGLAKLDEEENTHISTRIAGTIGYMAPEYAMRGYLTDKADVYSFGIVALEIVSGKSNTNYRPKEEFVYLLDWAYVLAEKGNLLDLVDPTLGSNYSSKEALRMLNLALLCTNPSPTLRPSMSKVVSMLDGKVAVEAPSINRSTMGEDARFKAFELLSHDSQVVSGYSQNSDGQKSTIMDGPWVDSSVSLSSKDDSQPQHSTAKLL